MVQHNTTGPYPTPGTGVYNVTGESWTGESWAEGAWTTAAAWGEEPAVYRQSSEIGACAFFLLLIILVALGGNLSVIWAIATNASLKDQMSNMFVTNLSLVDLSTTVVVMCTALTALVWDYTRITPAWCSLVCAANYCLIIVSMLTLSNVSIERYIAVVHAMRYHVYVTRPRILAAILYSWVQGVVFALVPVFMGWVHYDYWEVICAIGWQKQKQAACYYVIVACIVNFLLPGVVMVFCYSRIIQEARRGRRALPEPRRGGSEDGRDDPATRAARLEQTRAVKTVTSLIVVVAGFFIFLTPFCVTKLLKVVVSDPNYVPPYANLVASYLQYVASMVNPFIYGIFRSDFRRAYARLRVGVYRVIPCLGAGSEQNTPTFSGTSDSEGYGGRRELSCITSAVRLPGLEGAINGGHRVAPEMKPATKSAQTDQINVTL